jgi:hypothetical protein
MDAASELPTWLRVALSAGDVLVIGKTQRHAEEIQREHIEDLRALGILEAVNIKGFNGSRRIDFLSGGRIVYISSQDADERVRGMQVDHLIGGGYLRPGLAAHILRRPVKS